MEHFFGLIVVGIALEAFVQLLRSAWDADVRGRWNITTAAVVLIPVVAAFMTETNMIADSGLDFGQPFLGYLISGLVVGRVAQWVHDIYNKTT